MIFERLILGTAGIGGIWGPVEPAASVETVLLAMELGIGAIDTAPAYAQAERFVGEALRQWRRPLPAISSKVGRLPGATAYDGHYDYSRDAMFRSAAASLEKLGIPELDVLFLHDPAQIPQNDFERVVEVMVELKDRGYARQIGIGGNPPLYAWPWLVDDTFSVLMEYNRLNACHTPALETSLPAALAAGKRYYAASPLNMGALGRPFADFSRNPPSWLPESDIAAARSLHQLAESEGLQLRAMAHRFLLSFPPEFNIVIGPSNPEELRATLGDFASGHLPVPLFQKILQSSNEKSLT